MRPTFHLIAADELDALDPTQPYAPASLVDKGYIHCTDGADHLRETANRYYRADPRPFHVLTIDLDSCGSTWRIDEAGSPYPHIYGPVDPAAILDARPMPRASDGSF